MRHSSVVRPARSSLRASRASLSSRPVATSCSNCRSHAAASYSMNHLRNLARSRFGNRRTAPLISATVVMGKSVLRSKHDGKTHHARCGVIVPRGCHSPSDSRSADLMDRAVVVWLDTKSGSTAKGIQKPPRPETPCAEATSD